MHMLHKVQKLHGKLEHASIIFPASCAYLTNIEAMLGVFGDNLFLPRTPPKEIPSGPHIQQC
jgi:hypothetical protein